MKNKENHFFNKFNCVNPAFAEDGVLAQPAYECSVFSTEKIICTSASQ